MRFLPGLICLLPLLSPLAHAELIDDVNDRGELRIALEGELGALVATLMPRRRPGVVVSTHLVRNEDEQHLTYSALAQRFVKARQAAIDAATEAGQAELAGRLRSFQFRDLRARGGTDLEDLSRAKQLLGHSTTAMTEHYIRRRLGDRVKPVR